MENRRKWGDSIRQYKLCHPVVLTIFQIFAGTPAGTFCGGQIQQRNGKREMMRFCECSSVSWAPHIEAGGHNTWCCSGWMKLQAARQSLTNRKATGDSKKTRWTLAGWPWETYKLRFKTMRGKNGIFLPSFSHTQANRPFLCNLYKKNWTGSKKYLILPSVLPSAGDSMQSLGTGCLLELQNSVCSGRGRVHRGCSSTWAR